MKIIFIISLSILAVNSAKCEYVQKNCFVLNGFIEHIDTGHVILFYPDITGKYIGDTTTIIRNKFQIKGEIAHPIFVHLSGSIIDNISFFIEEGEQTITFHTKKDYSITGSYTQMQEDTLKKSLSKIEDKLYGLRKEAIIIKEKLKDMSDNNRKSELEEEFSKIFSLIDSNQNKLLDVKLKFIQSHLESFVSLTYLYGLLINRQINTDSITQLFNNFSEKLITSNVGRMISLELESRKIGTIAKNIITIDNKQNEFILDDLLGSYVLLNFWASWCIPCIEKFPHLKEMMRKYEAKGFKIVNISIDEKELNWKNAIEKFGLEYFINIITTRQIDIDYPNTRQPIPSQILINKEGIIIWNSLNQKAESFENVLEANFEKY